VKRTHTTWIPIGIAIALATLALVTMFGVLNGPIKALIENRLSSALNAQVTIESLEGNPFFEFSLSRVEVSGSEQVMFECGEAVVSYQPIGLLWGNVVVDTLRLVSPRLEWMRQSSDDEVSLDRSILPSFDLKSLVVDRGILTVTDDGKSRVAEDLHFEVGFNNTGGESALEVRRMKTVVLDPPIQIANLTGLALSREDVLVFREVHISSPRSSIVLSGEIAGLSNPLYRFDVTVDSLAIEEVNKVTGLDLPPGTVWLSGRIEGSRQSADLSFDWVMGGAAGDVKMSLSDSGDRSHHMEIRGREVDLSTLAGVSIRGDFVLMAEGTGLDLASAKGYAHGSVSNGSLYGVPVDSVAAEVKYSDMTIAGGLLLDGDIGTFYGAMRVDPEQRFWASGRLAGIDLAHAGGPETHIGGDLRVSRSGEATRIDLDLDRVSVFGREAGHITARLSQTTDALALNEVRWVSGTNGFSLDGSGHLWQRTDGLFSVNLNGMISPGLLLDVPDAVPTVTFDSRVWSESLTYGATRERIEVQMDLAGILGLDSLAVEVTADGSRIVLDRFEGMGESATLSVFGESILSSAYDLQGTYRSDDLQGVPESLSAGASGRDIRVTGSVVGPWRTPEVMAKLLASGLEVAGGEFKSLSVESRIPVNGDGGVSLQAESASWGGRTLTGFYVDVGKSENEISFLVGSSEGAKNLVSVWGVATDLEKDLAVRVDSAHIQLEDEYLANRGPISLSYSAEAGLAVHHLYLAGPSGELEAVPQDTSSAINIRVSKFDLAPWAFLGGMDGRLEGQLSGGVIIDGDHTDWTARTAFDVVGARVDSFRSQSVFGEVAYHDQRASGRVGVHLGSGQLYLEGVADMDTSDPDREVDLRLASEAVPLSAFNGLFPQVTDIDGELSGQVWLTGPAKKVELNGDLLASSSEFMIPSLNRGLSNVTLEMDVSPDVLTISQFDGNGVTGTLSASGTIELKPLDIDRAFEESLFGAVDLGLRAVGLDASGTDDVLATIDGDVKLVGTLQSPSLSGQLVLQRAEVRLLSMLQAPPDPESIWRTVPFFENLQCELEFSADRQLWVRDEAVNVELSGDLDVLRNLEDLQERRSDELGFRFFGTMNSSRGTYRFQNRNFRIWREGGEGGLRFDGERSGDPVINMKAWSRIPILTPGAADGTPERSEIYITALVTGSFAQPEVILAEGRPEDLEQSAFDDAEEAQARLLSYILFGRDPALLIAAEQNLLGEQSTGLLLGMATRELQSRIAQSLNLDMVQVEMGSASSIDRVTVGKYIGDRLFVTYEDQIGQGREFGVEYELFPRFSLESRFEETPDGQVQPSLRFTWGKDW
jgi:hypothetical protein